MVHPQRCSGVRHSSVDELLIARSQMQLIWRRLDRVQLMSLPLPNKIAKVIWTVELHLWFQVSRFKV